MPDYTPAEQGEIRADIESMYRSGRILLPQRAEALAAIAERMTGVIETVNARSAQMGDGRVLIDVLDMAVDCQAGVARSVQSLNNLGAGVVAIADAFVARDVHSPPACLPAGLSARVSPLAAADGSPLTSTCADREEAPSGSRQIRMPRVALEWPLHHWP